MKKLRLKALSLGAREILNREQLKSIYGGDGSGSGGTGSNPYAWTCYCRSYAGDHSTQLHFGCVQELDENCAVIITDYCYTYLNWFPITCQNYTYDCQGINAC